MGLELSPIPPPSSDPPPSQSLPVLIASALCYIWGAVMLVLARRASSGSPSEQLAAL